jgi:hypothetical protein
VLRDLVVANIFGAKPGEHGNAAVMLNDTVPRYRDFKVGRYIFETGKKFLHDKGIKRLYYTNVPVKNHKKFLLVSGFTLQQVNGISALCREI